MKKQLVFVELSLAFNDLVKPNSNISRSISQSTTTRNYTASTLHIYQRVRKSSLLMLFMLRDLFSKNVYNLQGIFPPFKELLDGEAGTILYSRISSKISLHVTRRSQIKMLANCTK